MTDRTVFGDLRFCGFLLNIFLQLSSDLYTRNLRKSATRSRLDRSIQITR
jgi:hypothetical protein